MENKQMDIVLESIFRETVLLTPYTSVTAFYQFCENIEPDSGFGENCVWQALNLKKKIESQGIHARLIQNNRHLAVLSEHEGAVYYMDPYLMHFTPIQLGEIKSTSNGKVYSAFPVRTDMQDKIITSRLRVGYTNKNFNKLLVRHSKYSNEKNDYVCSRAFDFDLTKEVDESIPPRADLLKQLFHPEQNNLSIRIIDPRNFSMTEVIYPICYYHGDRLITKERLIVRNNNGEVFDYKHSYFHSYLEKAAKAINKTTMELTDFILKGVRIYEKHAPQIIAYSPYDAYSPSQPNKEPLPMMANT